MQLCVGNTTIDRVVKLNDALIEAQKATTEAAAFLVSIEEAETVCAEAVHRRTGFRQPLPHAAAGERVVELRRAPDGAWRVVGVSG